MNKQEIIEKIKMMTVETLFSGTLFVKQPDVIKLIEQLDEPEIGRTDEAPRYVKNILAKLRELPVHDREVWLKIIMSEFKQDFSHAKWREGYEQGKLEGMVEREKVKVPQFVADVIEGAREQSVELEDAFEYVWEVATGELREWFRKLENRNNFARAWLDGYEVEKEKQYLVKIKATKHYFDKDGNGRVYFSLAYKSHFTKKQLEDAGFGWVFNCPGIEIEEVEL